MMTAATTIKKYSNRRLYDTTRSEFVTLDALANRISAGEQICVVDAESGEDITRSVLSQILLQADSSPILPTRVLEQLIRSRNDSARALLEESLPRFVDTVLDMQENIRASLEARGDKPGLPPEFVKLLFPWLDYAEVLGKTLARREARRTTPREASTRSEIEQEIGELRARLSELEARLGSMGDE